MVVPRSLASSTTAGGGGRGLSSSTRVLRKRGWRVRNRYTAMAKGDRLREERESRKRARKAGGRREEEEEEDLEDDQEEEEEEEAGEEGEGVGAEMGEAARHARLARILAKAQVKSVCRLIGARFPLL